MNREQRKPTISPDKVRRDRVREAIEAARNKIAACMHENDNVLCGVCEADSFDDLETAIMALDKPPTVARTKLRNLWAQADMALDAWFVVAEETLTAAGVNVED